MLNNSHMKKKLEIPFSHVSGLAEHGIWRNVSNNTEHNGRQYMDEYNGGWSSYEWPTNSVLYANGETFAAICTNANCYSG